mgnify:CR=1 FL=1
MKKENDILEKTLEIAENGYDNAYLFLLDAYKKSGIKLKLVLLCSNTKELVDMIKERDLENSVEILGFRTNPYPYIKNAKALILSSEREGLPTVLIESLILGTPVVSTNCISGPSEILTGELSKYLANVNDSDDLALKMNQILKDEVIIKDESIQKFNENKTDHSESQSRIDVGFVVIPKTIVCHYRPPIRKVLAQLQNLFWLFLRHKFLQPRRSLRQ